MTAAASDAVQDPRPAKLRPARVKRLPFPLFSAPMGLGGLGLAWREAGVSLGLPAFFGEALLATATLVWALLVLLHVYREIRAPRALITDFAHPARAAFAGAVTVGLMLVASMLLPHAPEAARVTWMVAVGLHLVIVASTQASLFQAPHEAMTPTPPLLIPAIGCLLAPLLGVKLGYMEFSWMVFGLGAMLWLQLQPVLMNRIVSGPHLPERLHPTLVIFLAPPSVGALSLAALLQEVGAPVLVLFGYAAFLAVVFLMMLPHFLKMPFALSWWGYTFPSAAFTLALFTVVRAYPFAHAELLLYAQLGFATLLVTVVTVASLLGLANGKLFLSE